MLVSAVALVAGLLVGLPPAAHAATARSSVRSLGAVRASAKRALTSTPPAAGEYVPVTAARIVDTRYGTGVPQAKVAANGTLTFNALGVGGVPTSGVSSVVLNISAINQTTSGHLTAYPAGSSLPNVITVDYASGTPSSDLSFVAVGSDGDVSVGNVGSGATDIAVDVEGYVTDETTTVGEGTYVSMTPTRMFDTRSGSPVTAGTNLVETLGGVDGIPSSGVTAIVLTLSITHETTNTSGWAWQTGTTQPTGTTFAGLTNTAGAKTLVLPVSSTSAASLSFAISAGSADLTGDVSGYFVAASSGEGSTFVPVAQARVANTANGIGGTTGPEAAGSTVVETLTSASATPAAGVVAAAVILTGANITAAGSITAYADGTSNPGTVSLQIPTVGGQPSNMAIVPVSSAGKADFHFNTAAGNLIVDVVGYFTATELSSPQDQARVAATTTLSAVATSAYATSPTSTGRDRRGRGRRSHSTK